MRPGCGKDQEFIEWAATPCPKLDASPKSGLDIMTNMSNAALGNRDGFSTVCAIREAIQTINDYPILRSAGAGLSARAIYIESY